MGGGGRRLGVALGVPRGRVFRMDRRPSVRKSGEGGARYLSFCSVEERPFGSPSSDGLANRARVGDGGDRTSETEEEADLETILFDPSSSNSTPCKPASIAPALSRGSATLCNPGDSVPMRLGVPSGCSIVALSVVLENGPSSIVSRGGTTTERGEGLLRPAVKNVGVVDGVGEMEDVGCPIPTSRHFRRDRSAIAPMTPPSSSWFDIQFLYSVRRVLTTKLASVSLNV